MRTPPMIKEPSSPDTPKPLIPVLRQTTTSPELRIERELNLAQAMPKDSHSFLGPTSDFRKVFLHFESRKQN